MDIERSGVDSGPSLSQSHRCRGMNNANGGWTPGFAAMSNERAILRPIRLGLMTCDFEIRF
jgi:hypothetical protein